MPDHGLLFAFCGEISSTSYGLHVNSAFYSCINRLEMAIVARWRCLAAALFDRLTLVCY
jgi:hypothetical protein